MDEARRMSWQLRDVGNICTGCQKAVAGPDAYVGPDGPPPGVLPRNTWVQPDGGPVLLPSPTPDTKTPDGAKPIPPATTDPQPMPKKPSVPDLPKLPVPEPPKKPAPPVASTILPSSYEPAAGITVPDVPRN
jgi:hypothetical protein